MILRISIVSAPLLIEPSVASTGAILQPCARLSPPRNDIMRLLTQPLHPGEVLSELYLEPLGMKAPVLAKHLLVPRTRIERLVKGETALTADTAMRLSAFFQTTPEYWMNLQRAWDLARARETVDVSGIQPLHAA